MAAHASQRPSSARTTAKLPNFFRYLRFLIISPSTSLGRARSMSTSTHLRVTLSFQRPHPSPLLTMHDICTVYTVPTRTVGPCEYLLLYALCDMRDSMSGASLFEVLPWSCAPHVSSASSAVFRQLMTCMTCDVACGYRRILSQSLFMVFPCIIEPTQGRREAWRAGRLQQVSTRKRPCIILATHTTLECLPLRAGAARRTQGGAL